MNSLARLVRAAEGAPAHRRAKSVKAPRSGRKALRDGSAEPRRLDGFPRSRGGNHVRAPVLEPARSHERASDPRTRAIGRRTSTRRNSFCLLARKATPPHCPCSPLWLTRCGCGAWVGRCDQTSVFQPAAYDVKPRWARRRRVNAVAPRKSRLPRQAGDRLRHALDCTCSSARALAAHKGEQGEPRQGSRDLRAAKTMRHNRGHFQGSNTASPVFLCSEVFSQCLAISFTLDAVK